MRECGITRTGLFKGNSEVPPVPVTSCGLLLDLDCFRKKETATFNDLCVWWSKQTGESIQFDTMTKLVKKLLALLTISATMATAKQKYLGEGDQSKLKAKRMANQIFRKKYTKLWPCLEESKLSVHLALCSLCQSDISVKHGGRDKCRCHVESK